MNTRALSEVQIYNILLYYIFYVVVNSMLFFTVSLLIKVFDKFFN